MTEFTETHSPCSSGCYHDLECGHRIRTEYPEPCGSNCTYPVNYPVFICPPCLANEVRVEIALRNLVVENPADDGGDMEMIDAMDASGMKGSKNISLPAEVYHQLGQQLLSQRVRAYGRRCEEAPKLDPRLQYFNEFPEAQEDGWFLGEDNRVPDFKPRKRPGKGKHSTLYGISKKQKVKGTGRNITAERLSRNLERIDVKMIQSDEVGMMISDMIRNLTIE
ncbi:hypothetical protein BS50DRAFT_581390 [Corynespora cassiicola Philippines]|uniref:Uncharacterized protein n=1 Tax=Corynespora cassiicola Philippines TaxID=1448308 RepID=A0A2T2PAB5_CORCC|nr:hypothetical protein BS50DRAFT_581390 [Corynespora cassiicola Philippines]